MSLNRRDLLKAAGVGAGVLVGGSVKPFELGAIVPGCGPIELLKGTGKNIEPDCPGQCDDGNGRHVS
jgi:hypothetical protein